MKLRFRQNSLRLRLNRREVEDLSAGAPLEERIHFPGDTQFGYVLASETSASAQVEFTGGVMRVAIPVAEVHNWAQSEAIGLYFDLPANGSFLKLAIEKDLECIDGPPEERDPDAYPRTGKNC